MSVYLDFNATTPLRTEARTAMLEVMSRPGNPSSVHRPGRDARRCLETARRDIAAALGAAPENLVFTSGGTEADILALRGCGRGRILASAIEHPAVLEAVAGVERVPVLGTGQVDLEALDALLSRPGPAALVSVMWANNETGVIQPLDEVVVRARQRGALVHSDAIQAAGREPIDFASSGLDMMSVSAHKLGGPPGIGALLVSERVRLEPVSTGGGQERGRRSGTENLPGIAGFAAALCAALRDPGEGERVRRLRDLLEDRIGEAAPGARILGRDAPRLGNTSCIVMPGVAAETQVMALDLAGVAVSAGSACSSGKVDASHVVAAMRPGNDDAHCAIRVSLGWTTGREDVERLVDAWLALYNRAAPGSGTSGAAASCPA